MVHATLLASGVIPHPSRCCSSFTRPWRRCLQLLFEASDLDGSGRLELGEMRRLANTTGEENVTDEMLQVLVKQFRFDVEEGLSVDGLMWTYLLGGSVSGDDLVLREDLKIFGLLESLRHKPGDVSIPRLLPGFLLACPAAAFALRGLVPRCGRNARKLLGILAVGVAVARPWRCRWYVPMFCALTLFMAMLASIFEEEDEQRLATAAATTAAAPLPAAPSTEGDDVGGGGSSAASPRDNALPKIRAAALLCFAGSCGMALEASNAGGGA